MSHRLDVLKAVRNLIKAALPNAQVPGLDDDALAATRAAPGGIAIIRAGAPGEPEVDLSPLTYNFAHEIPVDIIAPTETTLDDWLMAIGTQIKADRTLGGLCSWLEPLAAETEQVAAERGRSQTATRLIIVAHYATENPLH